MPERDRIAEPWGARTPYDAGEPWPVRRDMFLEPGLTEADVDAWVPSASILHSNGDGLDIAVREGRIVGVRGRAADRVNHGRLGPKDLFGWQANHDPDRLTRPLIRRGGRLEETDWDTAMDAAAGRTKELLEEAGPSSIGFYTSGQLFLEEYYTLALIGHGGIGTSHMDGNTRLCTATAAAALKESFACDGQPGSYADVDHADVIAVYGHNMAETQTVLWSRARGAAEDGRRHARAGPHEHRVEAGGGGRARHAGRPGRPRAGGPRTAGRRPMKHVAMAIRELHRAENDLAGALLEVGDRHRGEHELYHVGRDLAAWSGRHAEELAGIGGRHGLELDPAPGKRGAVLDTARRESEDLFGRDGNPELAVLSDLRQIHRMAAGVSLDWEVLSQTAQALQLRELLRLAEACHPETLRQLRWANAALKENAAQIMVSA
ncbi:molybdopterin-dependent oxidoreductase [Glycomyces sp. A-F 0318]|nr:molybdopterin-dependent oxidoreductase [Glycomyces amatae]MCD0447241.1 molybdopterin-dependent oxidoreductase [Glycomyces amatae]